ncbi:MBL fold metallo-hydrolase [Actinomadura madurae]|uniref:MBL fold metallo-hydrolase n=1 Tax=Actinomadura madurae TaxID=1993 RepID=UPI001FD3D662|nr:MBL fold metallo-hydrolase [Actinomadura madurae]
MAAGTYAWIQPDGSWWINNAGALVAESGETLIIDTCATARRTTEFLAAVTRVRQEEPIRYAVNTHHHGDHTFGNCLLPAETILIGHAAMRAAMSTDTTMDDFPDAWSPALNLRHLTLRLPDLTTRSELHLHLGEHEVHVLHPGYPAHTQGDLTVWVPTSRVLYTGDLLFAGLTPLAIAGRPSGMIKALDWISSFEPAVAVPGHGPAVRGEQLDQVLDDHRRYFALVLARARDGLKRGATPLETALATDLGEFGQLSEHERLVLNLHAAYAELTGRPVDRRTALTDAVTFLGQPMTSRA